MKQLNNEEQLSRDRIKELRKENNLSLEDLGTISGVSKSTVSRWESGDVKNLKSDVVQTICDHFHVSKGWLLGLDDPKYQDQSSEGIARREIERRILSMKIDSLEKIIVFIDQILKK